MAKALWQQPAPVPVLDKPQLAEEVARRTEELLESRGWCLWQCDDLGGEVIVVALGIDVPGIPWGKVVYTEAELKELFGGGKPVSPTTLRLIHEAKKRTTALVASPEPLSKEVAGGDPTQPCYACGSTDWWQRPDGGWVCAWCHPKPGGD